MHVEFYPQANPSVGEKTKIKETDKKPLFLRASLIHSLQVDVLPVVFDLAEPLDAGDQSILPKDLFLMMFQLD